MIELAHVQHSIVFHHIHVDGSPEFHCWDCEYEGENSEMQPFTEHLLSDRTTADLAYRIHSCTFSLSFF